MLERAARVFAKERARGGVMHDIPATSLEAFNRGS